MSRYKPGSGIAIMWAAYEKGGPAAVIKLGSTLNLASSTINTRIAGWEREKRSGGVPVKQDKTPKMPKDQNVPKASKKYIAASFGKTRVRCTYMPGRLGYIIEEGPEQTEVRWDDGFPEICIINRFLKEVKSK